MTLNPRIAPALERALSAKGYDALTEVQDAVLAEDRAGADLLVSAQTGSGKTVAFGLAIADQVIEGEDKCGWAGAPLALVVAPTRELALQVQRELTWLYADAGPAWPPVSAAWIRAPSGARWNAAPISWSARRAACAIISSAVRWT